MLGSLQAGIVALVLLLPTTCLAVQSLILGQNGHDTDCTLIANDAWNFNTAVPVLTGYKYENVGLEATAGGAMNCGHSGWVGCPPFFEQTFGGPLNGSGYVNLNTTLSWVQSGFATSDKSWMDYSIANEVTVSFHIRATGTVANEYLGFLGPPVVEKVGEVFIGGDWSTGAGSNSFLCMNLAGVVDPAAILASAVDCGSSVLAANNHLAATTNTGNITGTSGWHHVVMVYTGFQYQVWLDGVLEGQDLFLTGGLPNTTGQWRIGVGLNAFQISKFEIDNLQIFDRDVGSGEVLDLNCSVPD